MKWFNNMMVAKKVLSACSLFLVIIIGISLQQFLNLRAADEKFDSFYNNSFLVSVNLSQIQKCFLKLEINMLLEQKAAEQKDTAEIQKLIKNNKILAADYKNNYDTYITSPMTAEEKKMTAEFSDLIKSEIESRNRYEESLLAGNIEEGIVFFNDWAEGYRIQSNIIENLINTKISAGNVIVEQQKMDTRQTYIILIAALLLALGAGSIIGIALALSVSIPVRKCLAFAELLASSNFLERIEIDQTDELGHLGDALNKSADHLERLISEILMSSQNLVRVVEEIASGNENLSQRTSEQASALEQIAATVEETNASTKQNASSAYDANKQAEISSKLALLGGNIVEEAVVSISEINNSSKKISEIINMINEISFQTNLLALNAAVEAARAGEQGRGFAVVAGEVRNLAQRSAGAAKEISTLIKDSIGKIEEGTDLVNNSGKALKEIILSVKQVKEIISEIAASSDEQSKGIEQINTAVNEMDAMTQQNAALVEETAAASEEMSNHAQELLSMVQQFKIRDTSAESFSSSKHEDMYLKRLHSKESIKKPAQSREKTEKKYNPEYDGYEKF